MQKTNKLTRDEEQLQGLFAIAVEKIARLEKELKEANQKISDGEWAYLSHLHGFSFRLAQGANDKSWLRNIF